MKMRLSKIYTIFFINLKSIVAHCLLLGGMRAVFLALLCSLGAILPAPAYAGQIFFTEGNVYGPNAIVRVSGELDVIPTTECRNPNGRGEGALDLFPNALIYVIDKTINQTTSLSTKLHDKSGSPNLVQGTTFGGGFIEEIVATTEPSPVAYALGTGLYQVVLDECRDGHYDPGEDSWADFSVVIPAQIPPLDQAIVELKTEAGQRAEAARDQGSASALVFLADNAWQIKEMYSDISWEKGKERLQLLLFLKDLICQFTDEASWKFVNSAVNSLPGLSALNMELASISLDYNNGGFGNESVAQVLLCGNKVPKKLGEVFALGSLSMGDKIRLQFQSLVAIWNESKNQFNISEDPPDPDFLQPEAIEGITPFQVVTGDPVDFAIVDLQRNASLLEAVSKALLASLEKYQGAQIAGHAPAALLHARNIKGYARLLEKGLTDSGQIIDAFLLAISAEDRDYAAVFSQLQIGQAQIISEGFSGEDLQFLDNLGHSPLAIQLMEEVIEQLDLTAFDQMGSLETFYREIKDQNAGYATVLQNFALEMGAIIEILESSSGNLPPLADAGGPYTSDEGSQIAIDGSASLDFANGGLDFAWDIDGDGIFADATGVQPIIALDETMPGVVGLEVTDANGQRAVSYALLDVLDANLPPTITGLSPAADILLATAAGTEIDFQLDVVDPDADPVQITWFVNDEEVGSGVDFSLVGLQPGTHFLRVEARDNNPLGGAVSLSRDILVITPNLTVAAFDLTPHFPTDAATVTLIAEVKNEGMVDAANIAVAFSVDGDPLGSTQTITSLAAGEITTLSMDLNLSGQQEQQPLFTVTVDPDDAIAESNEDDNVQARSVFVRRSTPLPGPGVAWTIEKLVEGAGGWDQKRHSLVVGSDGRERFSYKLRHPSYGWVMAYAQNNGGSWGHSVIDTECCASVVGPSDGSLALASGDQPHVAYSWSDPGSAATALRYAYLDGGNWQIEEVERGAVGSAIFGDTPSLALDGADRPHIAYVSWGVLKYAYYDGTDWQKQNVESIGGLGNVDLALDSQGRPHVIYQGVAELGTVYAYLDGGVWHKERLGGRGFNWTTTSIAIDPDDHVHVSFWVEAEKEYKYGFYDGDTWLVETIDSHDMVSMNTNVHLALTSDNVPVVTYPVGTADRSSISLRYARRTADGWHIQFVDGTIESYATGISNDLVLTSADEPRIIYNYGNQTKIATGVFEVPETGTPGFRVPTPVAGGPYSGYEGDPLFVDAAGSVDLDGDGLVYRWDFDGDGVFDSPFSNLADGSFTYADDFDGIAAVEVVDPTGLSGVETSTVLIANVAPEVNAGFGGTIELGQPFLLSGSFTDPGLADTHLLKINWGDGFTTMEFYPESDDVNAIVSDHLYLTPGDYTVTVTVSDDDGGEDGDQIQVTVEKPVPTDTTPPTLVLVGDNPLLVECGASFLDPGATAIDDFDGNLSSVISTGGQVDTSSPGIYTLTYNVSDFTGNTATATRTVLVRDTAPPIITLTGEAALSLECNVDVYEELGAAAVDACDGAVEVQITGAVDVSTSGIYELTYTATDAVGNMSSVSRTVTVVDTTPPTIALNGEVEIALECGLDYVEAGVMAMDACDGDVTEDVTVEGLVDAPVPGSYVLTYRASDLAGNIATATRTVTVVDTTPPIIALNGEAEIALECGLDYVDAGVMAMDACDGDVTEDVTVEGLVDATVPSVYELIYTASDAVGNTATATRTVTVVDTTPPTVVLQGANPLIIECNIDAYLELGAVATDNCQEAPTLTITGQADISTLGSYVLTYTATDASGNAASVSRTVIVVDTTPPTMVLNGNNPLILECHVDVYEEFGVQVADACDPAPALEIVGGADTEESEAYEITYTATDASGNTTSISRTVMIVDTTPPELAIDLERVRGNSGGNGDGDDGGDGKSKKSAKSDGKSKKKSAKSGDGDDDDDGGENGGNRYRVVLAADDLCDGQPIVSAHIVQPLSASDAISLHYKRHNSKNTVKIQVKRRSILVTLSGPDRLAVEQLWAEAMERGGFAVENGQIVKLVDIRGKSGDDDDGGSIHYEFDRDLKLVAAFVPDPLLVAAATDAAGNSSAVASVGLPGRGHGLAKPVAVLAPDDVVLLNYPNPFNSSTTIAYRLDAGGPVWLAIYNAMGQRVRFLVQTYQFPGYYEVEWQGEDDVGRPVSSGMYFYRLISGDLVQTRRMVLVK